MKTSAAILSLSLLIALSSCREQQATAPAVKNAFSSPACASIVIDPTEWYYEASTGKWKSQFHSLSNGVSEVKVRVITSDFSSVAKRKGLAVPKDFLMGGCATITTVAEVIEIRE